MIGSLRSTTVALAVALVALLSGAAPAAYGHGDPSVHYLETGPLYPSFANRPSQAVELELLGLLQAAEASGYPIKVALVGAADDVSDSPEMLGRPQRYADQLRAGLEAERALAGPLIVVAPRGLGVAGRALPAGARERLDGVRLGPRPDGDELARAAMAAVRQVAEAGGHALPAHVPPADVISAAPPKESGSMAGWLPFGVFAVVFLLAWLGFEVRTRVARRRGAPAGDAAAGPTA